MVRVTHWCLFVGIVTIPSLLIITQLYFNLVYATGFESLSSVPLSFIIDIELMLVLAQISATFIAITAGFYTTKIISLVNEKSRINTKIKEHNIKSSSLLKDFKNLLKEINEFNAERRRKFIESVKELVLSREVIIRNLDQVILFYKEDFGHDPSDQALEIFGQILPNLIEESKRNYEEKKKLSSQQRELIRMRDSLTDNRNEEAKENERKRSQYEDLERNRDLIWNQITMYEELTKTLKQELNAIMYPKHIRFGFISFIIFAILGVIIPLTYGSWGQIILQYHAYTFPINVLILILFGIGLAFNLGYIYLELRVALKPQSKEPKSDTKD